uniref:Uncharacterized protein n=1 Tax=Canis lupus dingo TaxID=286419 RepID=A0A8C0K8F1_CANLU
MEQEEILKEINKHLQVLKESETLLQAKKAELENLKSQVSGQQQEMAVLDRELGHKKEELHLLQESMVQAKADLQEALRLGESEVTEKCNHIREVKSLLEELSFQKGELNVQISEKKTQLALIKQEIEKEEDNLQVVLGQMSKHKTGNIQPCVFLQIWSLLYKDEKSDFIG